MVGAPLKIYDNLTMCENALVTYFVAQHRATTGFWVFANYNCRKKMEGKQMKFQLWRHSIYLNPHFSSIEHDFNTNISIYCTWLLTIQVRIYTFSSVSEEKINLTCDRGTLPNMNEENGAKGALRCSGGSERLGSTTLG